MNETNCEIDFNRMGLGCGVKNVELVAYIGKQTQGSESNEGATTQGNESNSR